LTPEDRLQLITKYPVFSNCTLVKAPKLNVEVKKSLLEASLARDLRIASVQTEIGAGMSALGDVLQLLISDDNSQDNTNLLREKESDAVRW
jgi:hypothetical protein